jgi:hypothetical protein
MDGQSLHWRLASACHHARQPAWLLPVDVAVVPVLKAAACAVKFAMLTLWYEDLQARRDFSLPGFLLLFGLLGEPAINFVVRIAPTSGANSTARRAFPARMHAAQGFLGSVQVSRRPGQIGAAARTRRILKADKPCAKVCEF